MNFSSLWVGPPMTKVQETCLSSFVYYGHKIYLYVYDLDMDVPNGVIKKDARDITSEDNLLLVGGYYAQFSDFFRYALLSKEDTIWVDADTLCLKDDLPIFNKEYVFSYGTAEKLFISSPLKMPKDSLLAYDLLYEAANMSFSTQTEWARVGPFLFDKLVKKHDLTHFSVDPSQLLGISYLDWDLFWKPQEFEHAMRRCEVAYTASLFTSAIDVPDRNELPKNTAIEYFHAKFVQ